jgi:D-lactate dehydrogenase (cytochrome)
MMDICVFQESLFTTAALNGVRHLAPDDLYVTAGAGMTLAALQEILVEANMQVPLVSPWPQATLGGLAAANVNAPLRMKYGGWRDNLLSTTVALADGRVIRAGRPVVKNVAGYDIARFFVGSHGTLGLMCDVTLKLAPRPRLQRTLCVAVDDPANGLAWAQATTPHWLTAAGVVLVRGLAAPTLPSAPWLLSITLEGLPEDVETEQDAVLRALAAQGAPPPLLIEQQTATTHWSEFVRTADSAPCLVRIGIPPRHLRAYWTILPEPIRTQTVWCCDVANGLFYAVANLQERALANWLDNLRQPALALGGYAVVMSGSDAVDPPLDRWGYRPDGLDLMRAIKSRWDPRTILNPGEFIL